MEAGRLYFFRLAVSACRREGWIDTMPFGGMPLYKAEVSMVDDATTQRAFTTILEHFVETGRAPHYTELAEELDIGIQEAREAQRAAVAASPIAGCWTARDTDHIESWAPFSNIPTQYLISVDGVQKWYGQ